MLQEKAHTKTYSIYPSHEAKVSSLALLMGVSQAEVVQKAIDDYFEGHIDLVAAEAIASDAQPTTEQVQA